MAMLPPVLAAVALDLIFESPFLHVYGKHVFVDQAAAKHGLGIGVLYFIQKTPGKFQPQPTGNEVGIRRINIMKEHQRPK